MVRRQNIGKEELIRQAAIHVFARHGFHNTQVEEIAREAGVAVGTIYNYFPSKEEILLSIFEADFEARIGSYQQLRNSNLPIPAQIRALLEEHFLLATDRGDLAQVSVRERFYPGKRFKERIHKFHREMVQRIEALINEGVAQGWVRPCNPRIIAHALIGIVESVTAGALLYPAQEADQIRKEAPAELVDLLWNGLKQEEASA
ncbi:TetR/AcrR family transcriptional regulator [Candidatus Acetothermia bacterium]|jgi:TetR/AcrR family fatty acid metabolism transcriptional regulator|nr:TetR/AcrR family transcriptional regulator [Candidatus Acetothermia bacterium]MCI2427350.1 TetR/AcrR family transcriptional regulator [Candidatus Acetothermia bacterium]MCI2428110.1 TetR/AcrR family transcriptional regulator [Candidatus Acetothermia bacterium]